MMRRANESRRSDRQPPVCLSPPAAVAESYKHCSADLPPRWECSRMRGQQAGNAFVSIARKIVETPAHPDVSHTPQCTLAQQRSALPRASRIGHALHYLPRQLVLSSAITSAPVPLQPIRVTIVILHAALNLTISIQCICIGWS